MGKGKRLRNRRQSAPMIDADYPFVVDEQTAINLGREGLAELALHLWPKDCQTCGWDLGQTRPTVHVNDLITFASASLHHARCQPPGWTTTPVLSSRPLLSYATQSFLLPLKEDGKRNDRPVILVNPSLEQVLLSSHDGHWTVNTVPFYREVGLRSPGHDFVFDAPIPDIVAILDGDELTVTLDDTGQTWSGGCTSLTSQRVRELGGIILAISTAADPPQMQAAEQFLALMQSGQVAMGWVALAGTEALRPLQEVAAPSSLSVYLLHWGTHHATVGELLATTDRSLPIAQAQAWALSQINLPEDRLLPWDQPSGDLNAWYILDAISVQHYLLRRYTDAWKLIKVLARIDGRGPADETEAQDWATRAVRIHGNSRIISWVPGPSTEPGFTTLHGSGVPR
ncbi:MAG: hypothetical protein JO115_24715 [Pseudonocardiales bacterium]|nr:hypothetical protein [Pseudonocardiales bacterium]